MFADGYSNAWSVNLNVPSTFRGKLYASGLSPEEQFPKFARHNNGICAVLTDGHAEKIGTGRLKMVMSNSFGPFFDAGQNN